MHAFREWQQAFAETGAHVVLDMKVRDYLKPPAIDYFERQVFPQLDSLHRPGKGTQK